MKLPLYKRILLWIAGIYVMLGMLMQCAPFTKSYRAEKKKNEKRKTPIEFYTYEAGGRTMAYAQTGNDSLPMVLYIHGSPGGWAAFESYLGDSDLIRQARQISVDRPGYGFSGYGDAEPSLKKQAALIAPILKSNKNAKKPILVGHSLGGPLIARLAMDYPDLMSGLIFLAPSIDPDLEKYEWHRPFLKLSIIEAILPEGIKVSNEEILPLKKELRDMIPLWGNIKVPCTIIHGTKDVMVPYDNVFFYKKELVNAPKSEIITLENVNHFIPWSNYDTVKYKVLQYLSMPADLSHFH